MGAKFSSELAAQGGVVSLKLRGVIDEDNVLVHNFSASGVVKSFYAPYFCPRCNKERLLRLETRDLVHQTPITSAPTCRCDDCDGPMDFDDMEESYFAFMNNLKKVLSDSATEEILQAVAAASEGGAKQKTRGSSAGITPATGPGHTPATPSTGAPSSLSPVPRTPTSRSPSGAMPMAKTPPGNALSGLVVQQGESPSHGECARWCDKQRHRDGFRQASHGRWCSDNPSIIGSHRRRLARSGTVPHYGHWRTYLRHRTRKVSPSAAPLHCPRLWATLPSHARKRTGSFPSAQ